jgi:hypothetical protein
MLRSMMIRWLLGGVLVLGATVSPATQAEETRHVRRIEVVNIHATAKVGEPVSVPIRFRAPDGWFMNPRLLSGKVFAPEGITSDKVLLKSADAHLDAHEGRIDLLLTAHEAGKKIVPVALSYGLYADADHEDFKNLKILIEVDAE